MRQANTSYASQADIERLTKEYFGPDKPREIDYLAYLLDEYELNDWCKKAFPDMLAGLKSGYYRQLSDKQRASLVRAIKECDAYYDDVKKGYLTKGWADNKQEKPVMQQPQFKVKDDFHDMDDDIPF